ncbi:MAG: hydroxyacid dehydrogenase [Myxococcota bacterium]
MTHRILVSDNLSEQGLDVIRNRDGFTLDYRPGLGDGLAEALVGAAGLVIRSGSKVTADTLAGATALRCIARAGIGVDNIDVAAADAQGVVVMNTPFGNAITTAEHTLAMLMAVSRNIPQATASMKAGRWEKKKFGGRELYEKTLGVIGLGNIGRLVARRAQGLDMNVIGFDPMVGSPGETEPETGVRLVALATLWAESDYITVHTPLNEATRHLVSDDTIAAMKRGVFLVNVARGGIFDEDAVLRGLESGQVGGCAIDVYPEEPPPPERRGLIAHDRCIATPHLGASTAEAQVRVAVQACEQVVAHLETGAIKNRITRT